MMSSIFFSQWLETNNVVSVTFIKTQWRANLKITVKTHNIIFISRDMSSLINYVLKQFVLIAHQTYISFWL